MKTRSSLFALARLACAFATLALIPWGCGAPTDPFVLTPRPVFGPTQDSFTDEELLRAAYSRYRRTPGFYNEPGRRVPAYYLNTISVRGCAIGLCPWQELSTDDVDLVFRWADSTIARSSGPQSPIDRTRVVVTDRYIEFPRTDPERNPAMRAHRLSYFEHHAIDLSDPDSLVGIFNGRPVDTTTVRSLCEYLWFIRNGWASTNVVSSYARDESTNVVHTIFDVSLSIGDFGVDRDEIILNRRQYRVSKMTGEVVLHETIERKVVGRYRRRMCGG